jgi:hypothetical protein
MDEISYGFGVHTYGLVIYVVGYELVSVLISGAISCTVLIVICWGLSSFLERTTMDGGRFLVWGVPVIAAIQYFLPLIYMSPTLRGSLILLEFIILGIQIYILFALFKPLEMIRRSKCGVLLLVVPIYNMVVSWEWADEALRLTEWVSLSSQAHFRQCPKNCLLILGT